MNSLFHTLVEVPYVFPDWHRKRGPDIPFSFVMTFSTKMPFLMSGFLWSQTMVVVGRNTCACSDLLTESLLPLRGGFALHKLQALQVLFQQSVTGNNLWAGPIRPTL